MAKTPLNPSTLDAFSDTGKWRNLLDRYEEVLNLNIFIVDPEGHLLVHPKAEGGEGHFGASFLGATFGLPAKEGAAGFLENFELKGEHLEAADPFELRVLAVPIKFEGKKVFAYLVAGPVILSKAWEDEKYLSLCRQLNFPAENFLEEIHSIPRMSETAVATALNLLCEVIRDILELNFEKQKLEHMQSQKDLMPREIADAASDLYSAIQQDELLVTVLDAAINMSKAQGGSIMILDEEKGELMIRVSRGLENKKNILQARLKIGEGISGMAAKEKIPFLINGENSDARIRHLLKRPEIKKALVIPLAIHGKVMGVLNLYTKEDEQSSNMGNNSPDICQLSALIATALQSL